MRTLYATLRSCVTPVGGHARSWRENVLQCLRSKAMLPLVGPTRVAARHDKSRKVRKLMRLAREGVAVHTPSALPRLLHRSPIGKDADQDLATDGNHLRQRMVARATSLGPACSQRIDIRYARGLGAAYRIKADDGAGDWDISGANEQVGILQPRLCSHQLPVALNWALVEESADNFSPLGRREQRDYG
eukprot:scaffold320111_cov30-Tisochrysis_lutea.AAC.3